jgi:hypothetical protein
MGNTQDTAEDPQLPAAEEDPAPPPPVAAEEDTSFLGRVKRSISGLNKPSKSSSWIKMPFGNNMPLGEAAEAVAQAQNNPCPCLEMTYGQRFSAFLVCFAVGTVLSLVSTMNVPSIVINPAKFAIPFTMGNIVSLLSMSFLTGLRRQCSSLFHPDRALTTTVFMLSMGGTIVSSFLLHSAWLTFSFVIIQYASYIWYCASYVPYGRQALLGCVKKCWSCLT